MGQLTLANIIVGVLAVAGFITAVGGAIKIIAEGIRAAKAPNKSQDKRLDQAESDIKEIRGFLDQDKKRLDSLDNGNRVTQRALIALLGHGLDGNNQKQMQAAKSELESYLINR